MAKRVTLADVARRAGLSSASASLILNGRKDTRLSQDAHDRVRAAAKALGYRPNIVAQSLRTEKTRTIAFISDFVATTRFAGGLIRGALQAADRLDQVLLVVETEGDPDREMRAIHTVLDRGVDGIIFAAMTARELEIPDMPDPVRVLLLNATSRTHARSVLPDERSGGSAAVQLLADAGHRDIGLVGYDFRTGLGGSKSLTLDRRLEGIKLQMRQCGMRFTRQGAASTWEPWDGYPIARRQLRGDGAPRAFLCLNDRLALGTYQAIEEAGLHVPKDVSVVSFDDDEIAGYLRPGLTTVRLPHEDMGRRAVEHLVQEPADEETLVEMPVVERGSVGAHRHSRKRTGQVGGSDTSGGTRGDD
jgi:LacI family transcriptional regulator